MSYCIVLAVVFVIQELKHVERKNFEKKIYISAIESTTGICHLKIIVTKACLGTSCNFDEPEARECPGLCEVYFYFVIFNVHF
jgi:hypothetical protein